MTDLNTQKNEKAWEILFAKYHILEDISTKGYFTVSAEAIKELREPRLMTKFDHKINLPKIFKKNNLAILPIARGKYIISHFMAYHEIEPFSSPIIEFPLPYFLQSIDPTTITSEAVALNCAFASGILLDFLGEPEIYPTVSGRMGSGNFSFLIQTSPEYNIMHIDVHSSQIEIDGAFEGIESLALIEAKRDISDDFLVRQLYYPLRVWQRKVSKKVRPIFIIFSNGIYRFYEYAFANLNEYNSLHLIRQKNYSIESTIISLIDIENIFYKIHIIEEPHVAFPQADSFERVINICELLQNQPLNKNEITERYAFDARQTNYYTDAGRYLGLIEKYLTDDTPIYTITAKCRTILGMNFKNRQLAFCECILSHRIFYNVMGMVISKGLLPDKQEIVAMMKKEELFHIESESTFIRRASTIRSWINWILSLITYE